MQKLCSSRDGSTLYGEEEEDDEFNVSHPYSLKTNQISDFAPYEGLPDGDGAMRLTRLLQSNLEDEGLRLRSGGGEALVVILIQSGVREASTGDDVVFFPKKLRPPELRLRTLLCSVKAAMERVLLPRSGDGAVRKVNLQFLCVIDPTLSDQLLPVPKPAIASRIESVLATLPEHPRFSIRYSVFLPTCSVELRQSTRVLLDSVRDLRTIGEHPVFLDERTDDQSSEETGNPFSPQLCSFVEVFALNLQSTYATHQESLRSGNTRLLSSDLLRTCNQFLVLLWAQIRRRLTNLVADPMELSFVTSTGLENREGDAVSTSQGVVDDILGFDSRTLRWLRDGYALFPPAEATLQGMFLFNNPRLSTIWGKLNADRVQPSLPLLPRRTPDPLLNPGQTTAVSLGAERSSEASQSNVEEMLSTLQERIRFLDNQVRELKKRAATASSHKGFLT
jgi:hypothetical protein